MPFLEQFQVIKQIDFVGDQLTEARAYNCQKGFLDGDTKNEKLGGLRPKIADWHLKRTLYQVLLFLLFHKRSAKLDFIFKIMKL